jgi:6-phosphogluconolactonase
MQVMLRLNFLRVAFLLSGVLLLVNCGGPAGGGQPVGSGGNGNSSEFLYAATTVQGSGQTMGAIMAFPIDSATGALGTATTVAGPDSASSILANPAGTFLFVDDDTNLKADIFSISNSGSLGAISGSPFSTGVDATGLAMDPGGKFLYIASASSSTVSAYTVNASSGALTAISGSPFTAGSGAFAAVVDPSGKFLFVSDSLDSTGGISAFTINSSSGALTSIAGSPFATAVNGEPVALTVAPSGKFLYAGESLGGGIFGLAISAGGSLTAIQASAFDPLDRPASFAIDPGGKFLFAANSTSSTIGVFAIDSSTGALTAISGSPFSVSTAPSRLAIDSTGAFLYASNSTAGTITGFNINKSTGALTAFSGTPYAAGIQPQNLTVVTLP